MWLLNSDNKNSVKVEACQSTCLTVEKQCPFLIKGTEDDMASGNPSFMCKGKINLTQFHIGRGVHQTLVTFMVANPTGAEIFD